MTTCPACGSNRVFRSRTRGAIERLRRQFTLTRPYRCHSCNWRGWDSEVSPTVLPQGGSASPAPAPDLSAVDEALDRSGEEDT